MMMMIAAGLEQEQQKAWAGQSGIKKLTKWFKTTQLAQYDLEVKTHKIMLFGLVGQKKKKSRSYFKPIPWCSLLP